MSNRKMKMNLRHLIVKGAKGQYHSDIVFCRNLFLANLHHDLGKEERITFPIIWSFISCLTLVFSLLFSHAHICSTVIHHKLLSSAEIKFQVTVFATCDKTLIVVILYTLYEFGFWIDVFWYVGV